MLQACAPNRRVCRKHLVQHERKPSARAPPGKSAILFLERMLCSMKRRSAVFVPSMTEALRFGKNIA